MQIILYLLFLLILYLNYKIVISDIKEKKIPNKYLLYLLYILPIFYILVFWFNLEVLQINSNITFLWFIIQLIFIFLFCFILFYIGAWSAWDAKYILVLSLYIINIWVIPFIINISILTIIYLFWYFLYFYFVKNVFNHKYRKSLFKDIYNDIKEQLSTIFKDPVKGYVKKDIIKKALKLFITFLIVFVSFRLLRIYLFHSLSSNWQSSWRIWFVINYLKDYKISIIILWIIIFIILYRYFKKIIRFIRKQIILKIKTYLVTNKKLKPDLIDFLFLFLLTIFLFIFIIYEYYKNPYEITKALKRIFTFYIIMMIIWRILIYSYKIVFQIKEQDFIIIKNLKEWNIVDKKYLIKLFWTQKILWYKNKDWILSPDPSKYFNEIDNPIDNETRKKLQKIYKIVNEYHKKNKTIWFSEVKAIKILKTFAFWVYIFYGFIITIFLWNSLFENFLKFLWTIIKKHSWN